MTDFEYSPETGGVRVCYFWGLRELWGANEAEANAEFDRWLSQLKAEVWDEGFDAGERDVFAHDHGEGWDGKCIPNPYRHTADEQHEKAS